MFNCVDEPPSSPRCSRWRSGKASVSGSAGISVPVPIRVTPRPVAVMENGVRCDTGERTVTLKLADLAPAGTVTEGGLVSSVGSLLESVTITPPTGAEPASVTVPVNEVGGRGGICSVFKATASSEADGTFMIAVWLTLLALALRLTTTDWLPGAQRKVMGAEVAPAGTITVGATLITAGMLLES